MVLPGVSCGVCLRLIEPGECPSPEAINTLPNCDAVLSVGDRCEADGECSTLKTANNCLGSDGQRYHDVYERCAADVMGPPSSPPLPPTLPQPPTRPPVPPHPPLTPLAPCVSPCPAGVGCGVCLSPLADAESCPSPEAADALPRCDAFLAPGGLCEADGECGTLQTANTCHMTRDVYVREACSPPPEAMAPAAVAALAGLGAALLLLLLVGCGLLLLRARRRRLRERGPAVSQTRAGAQADSKAEALVVIGAL